MFNIDVYSEYNVFMFNVKAPNVGKLHAIFSRKMAKALSEPEYYIGELLFAFTTEKLVGVTFMFENNFYFNFPIVDKSKVN